MKINHSFTYEQVDTQVADKLFSALKQVSNEYEDPDCHYRNIENMDFVFDILTSLHLLDGYHLAAIWDGDMMGGHYTVVVRNEKDNTTTQDIFSHIVVGSPATEGVWQAYLLSQAWSMMTLYWHAGYERVQFVFHPNDLKPIAEKIDNGIVVDWAKKELLRLSESASEDSFAPVIELCDSGLSILQLYDWNDWRGLVHRTILALEQGESIEFHPIATHTLIPYDCGILF